MNELWNKRREKLETAVRVAALELFAHMGGAAGFECELGHGLRLAIGEQATMAPSREMAELALAALGHVRKPNDRCTARYAQVPKEQRKPGPPIPPIWCYLPLDHEGPHRCNHGGMQPSFPMSDEQRIVHEPLPDTCTKCRVRWPCTEANKVFASLQPPVPSAPDPEG